MFSRLLLILVLTIAFISCSKDEKIYQSSEKIDPYIAYKEGYDSFKKNNFFYANKKFFRGRT